VSLLDKFIVVLKISLQKPRESIKHLTISNFRTLFNALKYEEIDQIKRNYRKKLGVKMENISESHQTNTQSPKASMYNAPKQPEEHIATVRKKDFFNQWDDKYVKQHHEELLQFDRVNKNLFKSVVIIADLNLPQCKKYRVLQKIEILNGLMYHDV